MPRRRPISERLWEKIDVRGPDDCWPWTAHRLPMGYGVLNVDGIPKGAHVLVVREGRDLPAGYDVHHVCENPPCCNPSHLEPLPHGEHSTLTNRRGCAKHGEAEMGQTTGGMNPGQRYCKACMRERYYRRRDRKINEAREEAA